MELLKGQTWNLNEARCAAVGWLPEMSEAEEAGPNPTGVGLPDTPEAGEAPPNPAAPVEARAAHGVDSGRASPCT